MTAEFVNSTAVNNATATPRVPNNPTLGNGRLMEAAGTVTPSATGDAASVYRFCRIPSNCRVSQVLLSTAAAFSSAGAVDIGIYQTAANGGAVVDADLFASAQALTSSQRVNADLTYESGEYTMAESEKMLWEVLGLTSDPCREYDVAATVTTQFNGGQVMNLKVRYVL